MKRPDKIPSLMAAVWAALDRDQYLFSRHALERQVQRHIKRFEVIEALRTGHHEKAKDVFDLAHWTWNYAVKGQTQD